METKDMKTIGAGGLPTIGAPVSSGTGGDVVITPDVKYESYTAASGDTSITDILPEEGEEDVIYRVGNWDGTEADATKMSEYAWDGSDYTLLRVVDSIGEVFDISAYNASGGTLATYADLAAALGTSGANVPEGVRKGGMSVKYVQSSDNNYVQYLFTKTDAATAATFTNPANWQGVDSTPTAGSQNLVTSGGVKKDESSILLAPVSGCIEQHEALTSKSTIATFNLKAAYKYLLKVVTSSPVASGQCNTDVYKQDGTRIARASISGGQTEASFTIVLQEDLVDAYLTSELRTDFEWSLTPIEFITSNHLSNDAVTPEKNQDYSYIPVLLNEFMSGSSTDYRAYVSETHVCKKVDKSRITLRAYGKGFVIRCYNSNGGTVWDSVKYPLSAEFKNSDIIPLTVSHSNTQEISVGDIIGYIVFKDIEAFKSLQSDIVGNGQYFNKIIYKAFTQPLIYQYVKQFYPHLGAGSVGTNSIAEKAVSESKLGFLISKNLINTQDPDFAIGKRLETNGTLSDGDFITTGYLPVEAGNTYVLSASGTGGIARFTILYDSNKAMISGTYDNAYKQNGYTITIPEGAAYFRVTFLGVDRTNLQFEVGSTPTAYSPYKAVIPSSLLPESTLQDGSVTTSKIANEAVTLEKTSGVSLYEGMYISLPSTIYAVVGDRLQIFLRSIVHCPNPYTFDVIAVCSKGKSYPRYWEYTPVASDAGNTTTLTIKVRDSALNTIIEKSATLAFINTMSQPSNNKNVLCIGASATTSGVWVGEVKRRLTQSTGDGTPANPTGLSLNNITFVGRKNGTYVNVPLEATGGWKVATYASAGEPAFRFQVTGVTQLNIGDEYTSPQGGGIFVLQEINVTEGVGNLRFTFSTTIPTIPASGTLTRISGTGDGTIAYSSYTQENYSPFWNTSTNQLDFAKYANDWCNGSIDVMIWHCGVNDIFSGTDSAITNAINAFKDILRQYHTDFPSGKVIISSVPVCSLSGGMAANYGASGFANILTFSNAARKYALALSELCADNEFSSFAIYAPVLEEFDAENGYPTTDTPVNNRLTTVTEKLGTNGVHPTGAGSLMVADGVYRAFNTI